jgi:hypothetical protein
LVSRTCLGIAAFACAFLPQPVIADDADDGPQRRAAQSVFQQRLQQDQKLQDIGWKLVSGNAKFCANSIPSIGLQLHDMASYGRPDAVRELLGISGDIAVLTAAAGSPSAQAGLAANQHVTAIAGVDPHTWLSQARSDWQRTKRMHDWIDQRLSEDGSVTLTLAEGKDVTLEPVLACASRFELSGDNKRAMAEGSRVILGYHFPGFAYPEEELAAAIAHELAHNVLKHRDWLDANGRSRSNVRLTEREADRLMPWLLANAGYDPAAATRFMKRWGPIHDGGIFRKRTHDGWDERVEFIEAERALIEELQQEEGVDWRRHFTREITTP